MAGGGGYEVAAEHEHSNCVLIASKRYFLGGKWHTHIDYEAFNAAWREWNSAGGGAPPLDPLLYALETPSWAVFGAPERGFDPAETRVGGRSKKSRAETQAAEEAQAALSS